jgi:hypothetical protein
MLEPSAAASSKTVKAKNVTRDLWISGIVVGFVVLVLAVIGWFAVRRRVGNNIRSADFSGITTKANEIGAQVEWIRKIASSGTFPCPVTKPPAQQFVPPPPYWTDHAPDQFWYGTESLWTLLSVQGTWHIRNNVLEGKHSFRTKLTYWRRGFDWQRELEPELIVIAKRLDREAPPVAADAAHGVNVGTSAMMTGIDIPSAGCWELTAQYGGQRLSFVVSVQP